MKKKKKYIIEIIIIIMVYSISIELKQKKFNDLMFQ